MRKYSTVLLFVLLTGCNARTSPKITSPAPTPSPTKVTPPDPSAPMTSPTTSSPSALHIGGDWKPPTEEEAKVVAKEWFEKCGDDNTRITKISKPMEMPENDRFNLSQRAFYVWHSYVNTADKKRYMKEPGLVFVERADGGKTIRSAGGHSNEKDAKEGLGEDWLKKHPWPPLPANSGEEVKD